MTADLTPEHHQADALVHGSGLDVAAVARRMRLARPTVLELLADVRVARAIEDDADIASARSRAEYTFPERSPRGSLPAVCTLPAEVSRVEDLVHVEGLAPDTAARRLGVSVRVVEDCLHQARTAREALAAERFRGMADPEPGMSAAQALDLDAVELAFEGMLPRDIAARLGRSPQQVSTALSLARRHGFPVPLFTGGAKRGSPWAGRPRKTQAPSP